MQGQAFARCSRVSKPAGGLFPVFRMLLLVTLLFHTLVSLSDARTLRNKVLIISFDGFRWDYPKLFNTPNLDYVARTGVHAPDGVITAFVSKTFPTHHTIATGLYPESHGIVESRMFDPILNKTFKMWGKKNDEWWQDGEPIWITAQKYGLRSGIFFWPGSDVRIQGLFPTFHRRYNNKVPFETRVKTVVDWLIKEDVDLAMMYFNEPDHTGHQTGAASREVGQQVERVDGILGLTMKTLRDVGIFDRVNILIVSDHGMIDFKKDPSTFINLKKYIHINRDTIQTLALGPVAQIIPRPGKRNEVYQKLVNASKFEHMKVYLKENLPKRLHYKAHRRIQDIVVIAEPGYDISISRTSSVLKANHGYDNRDPSMKPIFYARGPDFKENYKAPVFETVNIYPLVCQLLGIPPAPNNGTLKIVGNFLKKQPSLSGRSGPAAVPVEGSSDGESDSDYAGYVQSDGTLEYYDQDETRVERCFGRRCRA